MNKYLKAFIRVIVALVVIFGGAFLIISLYWNSTLQPIIVAEGEEFVPPSDFPQFNVTFYGEPSPGSISFVMRFLGRNEDMLAFPDPYSWDYMVEYDLQRQQVVFAQKAFYTANNFARHSDNLLSYYQFPFWEGFVRQRLNIPEAGLRTISGGQFIFLNGDYQEIRRLGDLMLTDFHEMQVLDNSNILFLEVVIYDHTPWEEIGCQVNCNYVVQQVVEMDPQGNRVFEWDPYEYYNVEDLSSLRAVVFPNSQFVDVTHTNAIGIASDGNLLVSVRDFSEIVKVNRQTGEIIWRMGGETDPYNQFTFVNDPLNGFSLQHQVVGLENGNILLFDNGNGHEPPVSRAVEYEVDEENMTATLVWSYQTDDVFNTPYLGGVQRLPNGNTLVNFAHRYPSIVEVTPEGEVVMEITLPPEYVSYRADYYSGE